MQMETTKKAGIAILTSDKTDFKKKAIKRDKEGHRTQEKNIHSFQVHMEPALFIIAKK